MGGTIAVTQVLLVDDDVELVDLLKSYLEVEALMSRRCETRGPR